MGVKSKGLQRLCSASWVWKKHFGKGCSKIFIQFNVNEWMCVVLLDTKGLFIESSYTDLSLMLLCGQKLTFTGECLTWTSLCWMSVQSLKVGCFYIHAKSFFPFIWNTKIFLQQFSPSTISHYRCQHLTSFMSTSNKSVLNKIPRKVSRNELFLHIISLSNRKKMTAHVLFFAKSM